MERIQTFLILCSSMAGTSLEVALSLLHWVGVLVQIQVTLFMPASNCLNMQLVRFDPARISTHHHYESLWLNTPTPTSTPALPEFRRLVVVPPISVISQCGYPLPQLTFRLTLAVRY